MLPFKRILCPTDFSEPSIEGMKAANELALYFKAELYLVHVTERVPIIEEPMSPAFNVPLYQEGVNEYYKKALLSEIEKRFSPSLNVRPFLVEGNAAEEIIRVAEENDVDLIVISTHGRTGWRHLVFGSVAARVVRLAPCNVFTVRPPKQES